MATTAKHTLVRLCDIGNVDIIKVFERVIFHPYKNLMKMIITNSTFNDCNIVPY